MSKCEHGLTSKECYTCASPKHGESVPPQRKPLTKEEMMDEFCKTPGIHQFVSAFFAGARYAERAHGITS